MNSRDDVEYRLILARGFLREAEQDFGLQRWRSCVDNAQLASGNSGKAVLAAFEAPCKTHAPGKHLEGLARDPSVPKTIRERISRLIALLNTLGEEEHFMTDYGDEVGHVSPWDLFTAESAGEALTTARACVEQSGAVALDIRAWRANRDAPPQRNG